MKEKIKTSRELDKKQVRKIFFHDGEEAIYRKNLKAFYHYEYHGEFDDAWIVVFQNNQEIHRWNTKLLLGIEWMPKGR